MTTVAMTHTPDAAATRARVLKGSISYLLEETIDTCSEEGNPCYGSLRIQLSAQINELICLFRTYPAMTSSLPEDEEVLTRIVEELEGPEVAVSQLFYIRREFLQLLHPGKRP